MKYLMTLFTKPLIQIYTSDIRGWVHVWRQEQHIFTLYNWDAQLSLWCSHWFIKISCWDAALGQQPSSCHLTKNTFWHGHVDFHSTNGSFPPSSNTWNMNAMKYFCVMKWVLYMYHLRTCCKDKRHTAFGWICAIGQGFCTNQDIRTKM